MHSPRGRLRYADRSAGHAGATANLKLTFHLDHRSAGTDQLSKPIHLDDIGNVWNSWLLGLYGE
jgi:hypothetical protein